MPGMNDKFEDDAPLHLRIWDLLLFVISFVPVAGPLLAAFLNRELENHDRFNHALQLSFFERAGSFFRRSRMQEFGAQSASTDEPFWKTVFLAPIRVVGSCWRAVTELLSEIEEHAAELVGFLFSGLKIVFCIVLLFVLPRWIINAASDETATSGEAKRIQKKIVRVRAQQSPTANAVAVNNLGPLGSLPISKTGEVVPTLNGNEIFAQIKQLEPASWDTNLELLTGYGKISSLAKKLADVPSHEVVGVEHLLESNIWICLLCMQGQLGIPKTVIENLQVTCKQEANERVEFLQGFAGVLRDVVEFEPLEESWPAVELRFENLIQLELTSSSVDQLKLVLVVSKYSKYFVQPNRLDKILNRRLAQVASRQEIR